MSTPPPTYPLDALVEAMRLPFNQACNALGLAGATRNKYAAEGLTEQVADRLATRAGLATYNVWPEMLDAAIAEHAA